MVDANVAQQPGAACHAQHELLGQQGHLVLGEPGGTQPVDRQREVDADVVVTQIRTMRAGLDLSKEASKARGGGKGEKRQHTVPAVIERLEDAGLYRFRLEHDDLVRRRALLASSRRFGQQTLAEPVECFLDARPLVRSPDARHIGFELSRELRKQFLGRTQKKPPIFAARQIPVREAVQAG